MRTPKLDYLEVIKKYPWILKRKQDCIVSPDSDGLLCGLLMSHYLGWRIRGFYDGKVLVAKRGVNPRKCIFLDMEIFRPGIRSVGQHMVMYDKNDPSPNWSNFSTCIAANNLRNYDFKNDFRMKYPLGTVHLLLAVLGQRTNISISKNSICSLLYADGTFKNQFNYPENCLSWLEFLGAHQVGSPLRKVFLNRHYSTYELMVALKNLFAEIHVIGGGKRGGDKVKFSDSKGRVTNIDQRVGHLRTEVVNQAKNFLRMLAEKTGWTFTSAHWWWGPYRVLRFQKGSVKPGKARYNALLVRNPISFAIISRNSIEYTIDGNGVF